MRTVQGTRREQLLSLVLASVLGAPRTLTWAQATEACNITNAATPIRVEGGTGVSELLAAVNCNGGGTVEATWTGVLWLSSPISVGSGTFLSITGSTGEEDLAEVQGGSQIRLFEVSSLGGLSLTRLKVSGGSAATGGAIYSSNATLTLDGCVFDGNNATAGDGGAVWAEGGVLTVVGGEFTGNGASGSGGAVVALDAVVVIEGGTVFEGNTATREGGALYCGGTENSTRTASCSLSEAVFSRNEATAREELPFIQEYEDLYGGGAAAFYRGEVDVTDSVFESNNAQFAGGGIFGGVDSDLSIEGCTFWNNTTPWHGGAVAASKATLGETTLVTENFAEDSGGGVFGWDEGGEIKLNDVVCSDNEAGLSGGCLFSAGRAIVNNGTVMQGNQAGSSGGCIYADERGDVNVDGGEFTGCHSSGNGGFLFVSDGAVANITGGTVTKNVAGRRAGVVYCSGDTNDRGGSTLTIEGGTFRDNHALEHGGAIVAWGTVTGGLTPTVVTITGGTFTNNTAKFFGGFMFLEELASLSCRGATIMDHYAGEQGGAIYGREATWVNSSCDLVGNGAPQGAAVYLSHTIEAANFENHDFRDNVAVGGSVLSATETAVFARDLNFRSSVALQDDTSNRAVQLEGGATLVAEGCDFSGWAGYTVIHNNNPAAGSLVLDSCGFSENVAATVVVSPESAAQIRNAVVDHGTIASAAIVNGSLVLVDHVIGCGDADACGTGECVESDLGVLCECLEDGVCLDDGGALSLGLKTPPPNVTYSPDPVYFELVVSAAGDGTTSTIWNLTYEADALELTPFPSSGVLPAGKNITVAVTGTTLQHDVGGTLVSSFVASSVGIGNWNSAVDVDLEVESAFYLCQAFEYAMPADGGGVTCEQCVTIDGADGVDCEQPGATRASLPLKPGYWRSSRESLTIHSCLHSDACGGATQVSSSDDYCEEGYEGPYCAVCAEGHVMGVSHTCHSCTGVKSRLLIFAGSLFGLVTLVFLALGLAFLVGGLDAVVGIRQSLTRNKSIPAQAPLCFDRGCAAKLGEEASPSRSAGVAIAPVSTADPEIEEGKINSEENSEKKSRAAFGTVVSRSGVEHTPAGGRGDLLDAGTQTSGTILGASALGGTTLGAVDAEQKAKQKCCGLGDKIKRWASMLPMDKLKILVVVWQILTVFPSITGVDFPPVYSRFLSWINVVNLDVGQIFAASCMLPAVNFYHRLLLTTLAPVGLALVLVVTYWMAKRRAGIGSAGIAARRAAWSRHMAAGLMLTFLVFTSTSTMVFRTFPCDSEAVEGESFLSADFSLSCGSQMHKYFRVYAGIMIVVYPIGIPLLYAYILWKSRDSLNPRRAQATLQLESGGGSAMSGLSLPNESEDLKERIEKRADNPDLVPSMFLWKDYGPDLYYYEVIECARRILLTGVLIFFAHGTAGQAAMACIFAFVSLLGFELLRPHLDPADSWLYRLGCVIIFLSNFLALLIKVDAAGDGNRETLGGILVAVNIFLILAVLSTSWFATQQMVDDSREDESSLTLAKTMLTFEERSPDASPPPGLRRPHRVHPGDDASVSTAITPRATAAGTPLGAAASATPRSAAVRTLRSVAASTPRRSTASTPRRSAASTPRGGGVSAATVEALRREGQAAGTPSRPSR